MFHHLRGKIVLKAHTHAVVECQGVGYLVHISLHTYAKLPVDQEALLYTHFVVREDAQQLFGFFDQDELHVFRQLIAVSGVGPNTARVILSTLSPDEVITAILGSDLRLLKSVKGIGARTAERIIVDLKDKIGRSAGETNELIQSKVAGHAATRDEALSALETLGFVRQSAAKLVSQYMTTNPNATVEDIIKYALKNL
jgi:Holliday junction DNA helicase RuvA